MERRSYGTPKWPDGGRVRRRRRCFGQTITGILLGCFLGIIFKLQHNRDREICNYNQISSTMVRKSLNDALPECIYLCQELVRTKYNEDPLETINLTEGETGLVFVGVMTAQKYLDTRAVAVFDTWGRVLPGRVAFFSSEISKIPTNKPDLPLIRLKGVDDSYPPQKKSFKMLQYMWENYGDRFEWFIRADDDVYIRHDKLESFLRSVDSRQPLFIGQAGRGNQEEFGLLSLEYDENFCMGGPGIIMSRETLARVVPHIKHCLRNLYTTHEDVELGRCVKKFANVSCTWSFEMQTILYHNSSGRDAFTSNLKQKEVHRAITMHPVKQPEYLYKIHNYVRGLQVQELQYELILLHRDINSMTHVLPNNKSLIDDMNLRAAQLFGKQPGLNKYPVRTAEHIIPWDFIQRSMYSPNNLNPRRRIETSYREGIEDVIREVMEIINQFSRQRGRVIEYQDLLYGYYRLDPVHGADYILDLLLKFKKYRGRKMTVPVRRHAYLQQQFTGYEIREVKEGEEVKKEGQGIEQEKTVEDVIATSLQRFRQQFPILATDPASHSINTNTKIINFILPLAGRFQTFLRFIQNYEKVCLEGDEAVALVVVIFRGRNMEDAKSANLTFEYVTDLRQRYEKAKITVIPVADDFARALALQIGTAYVPNDASNLLFYIDVDMVFTRATLERIRLNTIRGKQVYFPVVFSEFDPTIAYGNNTSSPTHFLVTENSGYWRQFGFGIASAFRMDVESTGGFNTAIRGWGKEDVDLFDRFVISNLTIFRAADPTLTHVFHVVDCAPDLELSQQHMCKGTRADTYGSVATLGAMIYANPTAFFSFARNRTKQNAV